MSSGCARLFLKSSLEKNRLKAWLASTDRKHACKVIFDKEEEEEEEKDEGKAFRLFVESNDIQRQEFNIQKYFDRLKSDIGSHVMYSKTIESTQEVLKSKSFFGWEEWNLAYVSDTQVAGRGRGGNKWESPPGCLMCSFQVTQTNGYSLPMLQYLVALSILNAVGKCQPKLIESHVRIKWPNDIYARAEPDQNFVKIGGILCQSAYWRKQFVVTVGFGLNIDNQSPTVCVNSLLQSAGFKPTATREELLADFFTSFEKSLQVFNDKGFDPFKKDYESLWLHSQQKLQLEDGSNVVVQGLSPQGFLLATDLESGETHELHPDGNSLDFLKGLCKKKK